MGSGRYSHEDLLEQLDVKENRAAGISHCFTVLVDEPASYKMLAQSKTYGKWKASYETCHKISQASFAILTCFDLGRCGTPGEGSPNAAAKEPYLAGKVLAFCMPVDIAATASAPKDVPKAKPTNGVKK